jgi:DNA primase
MHGEQLARARFDDPRQAALIGALLDCCDGTGPLETAAIDTILAQRDLRIPTAGDYAGLQAAFLDPAGNRVAAIAELGEAVALLVERPALDAALADATARLEREFTDETYAEQQRLLKRKLEFAARLRQMASARAAVAAEPDNPEPPRPDTMAEH